MFCCGRCVCRRFGRERLAVFVSLLRGCVRRWNCAFCRRRNFAFRALFRFGKGLRLGGGFSAEFELPSLFADVGSSFGATLRGADGGEWVSWSVEFYADNVSVSISSSGAGSPIERDFPVLSPVEQSFGLSFSLEKSANGFYRATFSTHDETFELGSISLADFANGEFFISAIGQNFEMDKDNPLLVDFSYASSIPEPAAFAFAFGICVLSAAVLKRRG